MELRTKIILNTSEAHKESTPAGKLVRGKHAERLVHQLRDYNVDLFGKGPAQHLTTGKAMDHRMVRDPLIAPLLWFSHRKCIFPVAITLCPLSSLL